MKHRQQSEQNRTSSELGWAGSAQWHDSGSYDKGIADFPQRGGANGSIRFYPEIDHAANAGAQPLGTLIAAPWLWMPAMGSRPGRPYSGRNSACRELVYVVSGGAYTSTDYTCGEGGSQNPPKNGALEAQGWPYGTVTQLR